MTPPEYVGRGWFLHDDGHLGKTYHPDGGGEIVVTLPRANAIYPWQSQEVTIVSGQQEPELETADDRSVEGDG